MRRKEKEIRSLEEINRILGSTHYMTLAMCWEDRPYLVTLSHGFDWERNCLYFHCASSGKKLEILNANPRVWGQAIVDRGYAEGKCDHLFESVHFRGRVSFVKDIQEKDRALRVMIRQLEREPQRVMSQQLGEDAVKNVTIGRIDIQETYGKRSEKVIVS